MRNQPPAPLGASTYKQTEIVMNMKRFVFLATLAAGVTAAYLMQKRGESLLTIVKKTISNPLGALAEELKLALMPAQKSLPSEV